MTQIKAYDAYCDIGKKQNPKHHTHEPSEWQHTGIFLLLEKLVFVKVFLPLT